MPRRHALLLTGCGTGLFAGAGGFWMCALEPGEQRQKAKNAEVVAATRMCYSYITSAGAESRSTGLRALELQLVAALSEASVLSRYVLMQISRRPPA